MEGGGLIREEGLLNFGPSRGEGLIREGGGLNRAFAVWLLRCNIKSRRVRIFTLRARGYLITNIFQENVSFYHTSL